MLWSCLSIARAGRFHPFLQLEKNTPVGLAIKQSALQLYLSAVLRVKTVRNDSEFLSEDSVPGNNSVFFFSALPHQHLEGSRVATGTLLC